MEAIVSASRYKEVDSPICKYVRAYEYMELMVKNCRFYSDFVYRMLQADFSVIPYYFRNGRLPRKFENSIVENLTAIREKSSTNLVETPFDCMKNAALDMISRIKDADLTFSQDELEEYEMKMRLSCSCDENLLSIQKFPVKLRIEGSVFMPEKVRDIRITRLANGEFHIEIWER